MMLRRAGRFQSSEIGGASAVEDSAIPSRALKSAFSCWRALTEAPRDSREDSVRGDLVFHEVDTVNDDLVERLDCGLNFVAEVSSDSLLQSTEQCLHFSQGGFGVLIGLSVRRLGARSLWR